MSISSITIVCRNSQPDSSKCTHWIWFGHTQSNLRRYFPKTLSSSTRTKGGWPSSPRHWPTQSHFSVRSAINELCYFPLTVGCIHKKAPRLPNADFFCFVSHLCLWQHSPDHGRSSAMRSTSLTTDRQDHFSHVTSSYIFDRRTAMPTRKHMAHADALGHDRNSNNMETHAFQWTSKYTKRR